MEEHPDCEEFGGTSKLFPMDFKKALVQQSGLERSTRQAGFTQNVLQLLVDTSSSSFDFLFVCQTNLIKSAYSRHKLNFRQAS